MAERQNKCVSSQFRLKIKPGWAHQYATEIVYYPAAVGRNSRNLTKGDNVLQKARCRHILKNFGPLRRIIYAYDGQTSLYTAQALDNDISDIQFPMDEFLRNSLDDGEITVSLRYIRSIELTDYHPENQLRLRNLLDTILSQDALEREYRGFLAIRTLICEKAETSFVGGLAIRNGCSKSIQFIKSEHGPPQPVVSMSSTNKFFYPNGITLFDLQERLNYLSHDEIENLLQNIQFQPRYSLPRVLYFDQFSTLPIRDIKFMFNGQEISVEEYLLQIYNVQIQFPNSFGAVMNQAGVFPMEQLNIVPDQLVPDSRLPAILQKDIMRLNCIPPSERSNEILKQFNNLEMNNPITNGFGVFVERHMIQGTFHRLNKFPIIGKGNSHLYTNDFGMFKFGRNQFVLPGSTENLILYSPDQGIAAKFFKALKAEAQRKGVILPSPKFMYESNLKDLHALVTWMKQFKNGLIFFINSGFKHDVIKLAEAMASTVITQEILLETADNADHQFQTMENIVLKTNIKMFGLNVQAMFNSPKLDLNKGNIIVISVDATHPTGNDCRGRSSEPSFVGWCANCLKNPCSFVGNVFAQETRKESVDTFRLRSIVKEVLEKVSKERSSDIIDTVIFLRDGVSVNKYQMVLEEEIAAIRNGCFDYFGNWNIKVLGLVVTKSTNVRHFNVSNGKTENLPPRSVVTYSTRHGYDEFYIVGHRAFHGTAKSVLCTVIKNDLNVELTLIQDFILRLMSLHQICNTPISLPCSIHLADKLAKRGQDNFRCFRKNYPHQYPNFNELTTIIAYNSGKIPDVRFTA